MAEDIKAITLFIGTHKPSGARLRLEADADDPRRILTFCPLCCARDWRMED